MLGRLVGEAIRFERPAYFWGDVLPILQKLDLLLVNLECVISDKGEQWTRTPKVFHFRAKPKAIDVLKVAGVDYVSLANNHTLDYGEEAMLDTLRLLEKNKIASSGAGKNFLEASQPAFLKVGDLKLSVLSITDNEPGWKAGKDRPGVYYMEISTRTNDFKELTEKVRAMKKNSDLAILSAHWGPNMIRVPSPSFQEFARAVIDSGVAIFHGHSSHLFQGVEVRKKSLIMYDCGDFIDDYYVAPIERNDQSFLFVLNVQDKKIKSLELFPVFIENFQVNLARGIHFEAICDKMIILCNQFGTKVQKMADRLIINL